MPAALRHCNATFFVDKRQAYLDVCDDLSGLVMYVVRTSDILWVKCACFVIDPGVLSGSALNFWFLVASLFELAEFHPNFLAFKQVKSQNLLVKSQFFGGRIHTSPVRVQVIWRLHPKCCSTVLHSVGDITFSKSLSFFGTFPDLVNRCKSVNPHV